MNSDGSSGVTAGLSSPNRASPAMDSTRASTLPSASLRSRVSTLPRIGTISRWRPMARSRAARRGDPVPICAPGGSASRLLPPGQTSASRGSSRAGNAATRNPGTRLVGKSLPEWTTRSTAPRSSASRRVVVNTPVVPSRSIGAVDSSPRRRRRDQDGRLAAPLKQLPGDPAGLGQRERTASGTHPQRTRVWGAHVLASAAGRSKSSRSASR
jgi:hypothetical protein